LIFYCSIHASNFFLGSYFQRARRRMTSQSGEPFLSPNQKIVRLFGGRSSDQ
jgi:hypothetical protein